MAVTYDQVRRIALELPGVATGAAYGGPSLHVGRKFLGRLREDGETFVLKVDPAERESLLSDFPDVFWLTDHYREHPLVLVNPSTVEQGCLSKLIERAWRMLATKRAVSTYDARVAATRT